MQLPKLRVSDDGRYLCEQGTSRPFFYLGDTAWELIHRCHRGEVDHYLANRAAKGFNVVQTVILAEINGLTEPSTEGHLPLIDRDPARPNEPYFQHVDYVVRRAGEQGMYVGLLPTWGSWVTDEKHPLFAPFRIFTPENARVYGRYLGQRYRDAANIIWILGGDRNPDGHEAIWHAMAAGLREGDGGSHLITYHPRGESSTADFLHDTPWLDFNLIQSSHGRVANDNYTMIAAGYDRTPAKPIFDAEPCYEDLPVGYDKINGMWFDAYDCRRAAYWSVFAGACGHTYGTNAVWQMYTPDRQPIVHVRRPWKEALDLPGAYQMGHLKHLMLSRPWAGHIPDQSILLGNVGKQSDHRAATRDGTPGKKDATWLMCYFPMTGGGQCDTSVIAASKIRAWWYDPRHGVAYDQGTFDNTGQYQQPWHTRPWEIAGGPDWVLVIDDASKDYPRPGR